MDVKVQNIRHWIDGTCPVVVYTDNEEDLVSWLSLCCPDYQKLQFHGSSVPGLPAGWTVASFVLTEGADIMMFKLTYGGA